MTLTEVFVTLEAYGHIPTSRSKDLKTSIRYLACALGKTTPDACHQEDFLLSPSVLKDKLDTYFGSLSKVPSRRTIHNTRTNLNFLFRKAQETDILSHPKDLPVLHPRTAHEREARLTSPYRQRWLATHTAYGLTPD